MCGICGKLNFDPQHPVDPTLLARMTGSFSHRGPDGTGEFRSPPVGLGHRRLSIIDLSTLRIFLSFQYLPGEQMLLRGIRKLMPSCYMLVEGSQMTAVPTGIFSSPTRAGPCLF